MNEYDKKKILFIFPRFFYYLFTLRKFKKYTACAIKILLSIIKSYLIRNPLLH